jgi:hypothetical protein
MIEDYSGAPATVIGDLVASRAVSRRGWLNRSLAEALGRVNGITHPTQPLQLTMGDEFQGVFHTVAQSTLASLLVRLELQSVAQVDVRFGLGYGSIAPVSDRFPAPQDGPGWWSARDAVTRAKSMGDDPRTTFVRTFFTCDPQHSGLSAKETSEINAFLFCRDALVHQMNPRQRRLLLGLLQKRPQAALAEEEGITPSAVSQNLSRSGAYAIETGSAFMEKAVS